MISWEKWKKTTILNIKIEYDGFLEDIGVSKKIYDKYIETYTNDKEGWRYEARLLHQAYTELCDCIKKETNIKFTGFYLIENPHHIVLF